jgi:hypothetical protein
MRVATAEDTPWAAVPNIRGGTITFKTLLEGREGTRSNYQLVLADTDRSFASPRHRHNFDQLRYALVGATNYGVKRNLEPGDLAYFPEGTYYGPQNQSEVGGSSLSMVIQFGGPSGSGYMSRAQFDAGYAALATRGSFERGVYKQSDGRSNKDSYEAIWEQRNGRPIGYSRPRFLDPVHLREENFEWQPTAEPGVAVKHLGRFTERDVSIDFLRLDAGVRHTSGSTSQSRIVFVKSGAGSAGTASWRRHSAIDVAPGEAVELVAESAAEFLVLTLSRFADAVT